VRDLHAWGVSTSRLALTAHVVRLEQAPTDDGHALLVEARRRLQALGIRQSTLQLEVSHEDCPASP
jgi:cobalt-zinc-cadmium efflux system protein